MDQIKEEILQSLSQQYTTAHFACVGQVPDAPNPGLVIEGLGIFGFPLSQREAQVIISKCRKSPVGKGTETLLDDKVRKSWELNPSQFSIQNARWRTCIESLLSKVYGELGLTCGRANVRAEPYKLLVYEEGAFFKPHQDSEKTPGMFGTMVVSLPSQHEGGNVILTHNKSVKVYDSSQNSNLVAGTSFGAWYSNVYHEVKAVTSGYRVVLTYNLVQDTSMIR